MTPPISSSIDLFCYETLDDHVTSGNDDDLHRLTDDVLNQLMSEYLTSLLADQAELTRALDAYDDTGVSNTSESTVLSSKMRPTMRCLWQS